LQPPKEQLAAPPPRAGGYGSVTEALVIFAISAVATRLLSDLAGASALVGEYLFTLVAAVFLGLPYFWLTRKGRDLGAHAMTWEGWRRGAALALVLTVATALPFWGGYHLWRTQVQHHTFDFSWDNYLQLPVELEGAPPPLVPRGDPQVSLWRDGRLLLMRWTPGAQPHQVQIALDAGPEGRLTMVSGSRRALVDPALRRDGGPASRLVLRTTDKARVHGASFLLRGGQGLGAQVWVDGKPVTAQALRLGPGRLPPEALASRQPEGQGVVLDRGLGWLPLILIAQFLLVAFPEEFFYRGYLQTTFNQRWPGRLKLGPFEVGPSIVLTSLLFGLGHFVINLQPARFAVFFPSLLFGWLRDRTGTIVSCVIYHAACNLMVEAATHHYF
jgi:membrane protease YdiL (CAAX protease family)